MLRLTETRRARGWSKAELARRARIDQALMSKIELGRLRPYPVELRRLARALGLPADASASLLVDDPERPGATRPARKHTRAKSQRIKPQSGQAG